MRVPLPVPVPLPRCGCGGQLLGEAGSQLPQPAVRPAVDPLPQARLATNPLAAIPSTAGGPGRIQTSLRGISTAQGGVHIPGPVQSSLGGGMGAGGNALRGHFSFSAAGAGAVQVQPLAVARPGAIEVTAQIIRTQGVSGLFQGVSATALRQVRGRNTLMPLVTQCYKRQQSVVEPVSDLLDSACVT